LNGSRLTQRRTRSRLRRPRRRQILRRPVATGTRVTGGGRGQGTRQGAGRTEDKRLDWPGPSLRDFEIQIFELICERCSGAVGQRCSQISLRWDASSVLVSVIHLHFFSSRFHSFSFVFIFIHRHVINMATMSVNFNSKK
jgi:hypothetical protein